MAYIMAALAQTPTAATPTTTPPPPAPSAAALAELMKALPGAVNQKAPVKVKSLFFSPEELSDIRYAVNIYRKNSGQQVDDDDIDEEDFLRKLTKIAKTQDSKSSSRYYTYPQFFMESLVYYAQDNWIVWINGQKITQVTSVENSELSVVSITPDKAEVQWKPLDMEKIESVVDKLPSTEAKISKREGTVTFVLKPNQTFSSFLMAVLEGKVQSVTVDTHALDISEPAAEATEEVPIENPAAEAGDEQSRQGLKGLIGAYEKLGQDKP
jgi:hypothetical protein